MLKASWLRLIVAAVAGVGFCRAGWRQGRLGVWAGGVFVAAADAAPATSSTRPAGPAGRAAAGKATRRPKIHPDQLEKLKTFLGKYLPEWYERIGRLEAKDPRLARRQWYRAYWFWVRVSGYPPKVLEAAVAHRQLARSILEKVSQVRQAADPDEKAKLTAQLRELLGEDFNCRQIVQEHHVEELCGQLAELRASVARRRRNRAETLEARLARLLGPPASSRPSAQRPPRPRRAVAPKQEAELRAALKAHAPELHEHLEHLGRENPAQLKRIIERLWRFWRRVREYPPAVRDAAFGGRRLNVSIDQTVAKIRRTEEPSAKAELVGKLRRLLAEQLEHALVVDEYRITRLDRQLAELTAQVRMRRAKRETMIAEWLERLLRPPVASRPAAPPAAAGVP